MFIWKEMQVVLELFFKNSFKRKKNIINVIININYCCQQKVNDDDDISRLRHQLADLHIQLEEQEKQYQSKCRELDMVAQKLNIKVTTHSDKTDHSDMVSKTLTFTLKILKFSILSFL